MLFKFEFRMWTEKISGYRLIQIFFSFGKKEWRWEFTRKPKFVLKVNDNF